MPFVAIVKQVLHVVVALNKLVGTDSLKVGSDIAIISVCMM